jgi:hypothetical protein
MNTSYNFMEAQRLLIKPFERLEFVTIFVLTTGLSQVLANLITRQPTFDLLWERSQIQYGIAAGIITGVLIGASQWLVLRKYVSDWKWILVVGVSTTLISTIRAISNMWRESMLAANRLSVQEFLPEGIIIFLALISSLFIYGYLQWYVLRPYIAKARWWIFVPFIAALFIAVLSIIHLLGLRAFRIGIPSNLDIIQIAIFPATQAIGFCILRRKHVNDYSVFDSPLALSSDVVEYWEILRLEKLLYERINQIWQTDLDDSIGKLTYLVGVDLSSTKITYEPVNQTSSDNVNLTPLPELSTAFNPIPLESNALLCFAKFQVVFTSPGMVQIYSWRGTPLIWLGAALSVAIIGMNILSVLLKIDILSSGK